MSGVPSPRDLWRELGITDPDEVDLEVIAFYCGARVKYRHLNSCAARIVGHGNRAIITVDPRESFQRQRFSIAHELGHWLQDRGEISLNCRQGDVEPFRLQDSQSNREAAANRFAVELLMPTSFIEVAVKNQPITMAVASTLASRFGVSLTAAAIRLVELGSYPSLVVCSSKAGYQWSWRQDQLPLAVRVNRQLSKHSQAHRLLSDPHGQPNGPVEVDADDWAIYPQSENDVVLEDSVRLREDIVLSLIWWRDETPLLEFD